MAGLNQENQQPFWFQMSEKQQQKAGKPWGPVNPQALNRYSYVQNNPLRYTDPTGHCLDGFSTALCLAGGFAVGITAPAWLVPVAIGGLIILGAAGIAYVAVELTSTKQVVSTGDVNLGSVLEARKKTKQSGKEAATDIPSWAKGKTKQANEDGKTAAKRIMNEQYGEGNWEDNDQRKKEYSQIKKNLDRKDPR